MSCILIHDKENQQGSFACNTTDVTFGPLMYGEKEKMDAFWDTLKEDPRSYKDDVLCDMWNKYDKTNE